MGKYDDEFRSFFTDFEFLLLHGIFSLQQMRSIYGFFHLLQGKRSSQTIQDGHLFRLLPCFRLLPHLKKNELEKAIVRLEQRSLVRPVAKETYELSDEGRIVYERMKSYSLLAHFNGWRLKHVAEPFAARLRLFIQSLSYAAVNDYSFIPNTKDIDIQQWVQRHFPKKEARENVRTALYEQLSALLREADPLSREIFVRKLSGSQFFGETNEQLSIQYQRSVVDIELRYIALIHQLIIATLENRHRYFALVPFLDGDEGEETMLTASAATTLTLYKNGCSIQQIARQRRLRENTIEDHLVEAFFFDRSLSLRPFVSEEDEQQIISVFKKMATKKLRLLKQALPERITYFQIRLVLAKGGWTHDA